MPRWIHPERPEDRDDNSHQLLSWSGPFVIGLVLFLIMLAVYAVRPALHWLGLQ